MIGTCTVYTSYEAALLKFVAWQLHSSKFLLTACRIRIHVPVSHLAKCFLPIHTKSISDSNQWFERKNKAEKKTFFITGNFRVFLRKHRLNLCSHLRQGAKVQPTVSVGYRALDSWAPGWGGTVELVQHLLMYGLER